MNQNQKERIVSLLHQAALQARHWESVGFALKEQLEGKDDPLLPFVFAFLYYYVEPERQDIRDRRGPFAPIWEGADGSVFPPPLESLPEEMVASWANVYSTALPPIIASRLADLLWVRRYSERPYLYAQEAVQHYLVLCSEKPWDSSFCMIGLPRALEVSREINHADLQVQTIQKLIEAALFSLNEDKNGDKPGVVLRFIEALMRLPKEKQPTQEIYDLLEKSLERYGKDPFQKENILMLKLQLAQTSEERLSLRQDIVSSWMHVAEKETGVRQLFHYQHALELAHSFGLSRFVQDIRLRIQQLPIDESELHTISAEIAIPREKIEEIVTAIVGKEGWREALSRFGAYGPLSGEYNNNVQEIKEVSKQSPFLFLLSRVVLDQHGFPTFIIRDEAEHLQAFLAQYEAFAIQSNGVILIPRILERIWSAYAPIPKEEVIAFFTTPLIGEEIADSIATSLWAFWHGRYDEAAHMLAPRIEAIIRSMAREMGIAIYREPSGKTPGGVAPLGDLLGKMKGLWDESWRRYFVNLLVHPLGVNLRNRIAHGLITKANPPEAALLIHAVCHLRLIRITVGRET